MSRNTLEQLKEKRAAILAELSRIDGDIGRLEVEAYREYSEVRAKALKEFESRPRWFIAPHPESG